ncbi:MAG: hypothetical protein KIH69_015365 [Anaerolineae bacterium]|nr:hypothetical protein [Anaerolineae bacterium]
MFLFDHMIKIYEKYKNFLLFFIFMAFLTIHYQLYASTGMPCGSVSNSLRYTLVWGSLDQNGVAMKAGQLVEAINPRGDVVGCVTSSDALYGQMFVYGEERIDNHVIVGMRDDEEIVFRVNGRIAMALPKITFSNDKEAHKVDLSVLFDATPTNPNGSLTSTPTPTTTAIVTLTPTTLPTMTATPMPTVTPTNVVPLIATPTKTTITQYLPILTNRLTR